MAANSGTSPNLAELQGSFLKICENGDGVPDISRLTPGSWLYPRIASVLKARILDMGRPGLVVPTHGFRMGEDAARGIDTDIVLRFKPDTARSTRYLCDGVERIVVTTGVLDSELYEVQEVVNALDIGEEQLAVAGVWDVCAGEPRADFAAPIVSVFPISGEVR